ncbi:MAG: hypothetical protein ABI643_00820 [Candidatus Doudnabacteria bacterium]
MTHVNRIELRKDVWRAVRQLGIIIQMAPVDQKKLADLGPGLIVFAADRDLYDDGRVEARIVGEADGQEVLFLPFVESAGQG